MSNEKDNVVTNPILSTIFELDNGGVVSVKGDVGNDCARALHEVYKKQIDPASGYVLESMQQDEQLNNAVLDSVVSQRDYFNSMDKHYTLVYTVDPATITPIDLIDFKASANETVNDPGEDADMVVYVPTPISDEMDNPAVRAIDKIARDNQIKIIHGMESLIQHLKGV
jgi:hypothetical protein